MSFIARSPDVCCKGGYINHGCSLEHDRRGANDRPFNKKVTSGKWQPHGYHKRPNDDHNVLLHRLSMPSPTPPSGSLLERIGGTVEDEAGLIKTESDRIDGEICVDLPFSSSPRFRVHTPEPGEVERFLRSAIGTPLVSPHVYSEQANFGTRNPQPPRGSPSALCRRSLLYSPTQTAVNSLQSANVALDHCQQSPLSSSDIMPPLLSASTVEECKKHLVPVLLASARARDPGTLLDSEQCHKLLSDDLCTKLFWQAKEMRRQHSSMVTPKLPVCQSSNGSLKRDRADEVETWTRNTRSRFNSMSDVSRRDSDITLVDFAGGRSLPKAPRAMLQASQVVAKNGSVDSASDGAPKITSLVDTRLEAAHEALIASPTTEDSPTGTTTLFGLTQRALKMLPSLGQSVAEIDTSPNVSIGQFTTPQSGHLHEVVSPTHPTLSNVTDFATHLPTQPGVWFKRKGSKYSEIVNVDVEVSHEMFYLSVDRLPSRVRMHLHLCSVPANNLNSDSASTMYQSVKDLIDRRALRWPKKGSLVVQINPGSEGSQTWLHHNLESDPLDVTTCIRPGKNLFRFIQLSDQSDYTFFLFASPPSEEEAWRDWDWASLVAPSHASSSSTDDHAKNSLSEFTRLPVRVRS